MAAPLKSRLDGNQVLQHAFIDATGELRVNATFNPGGGTEVEISHLNDSIRIGDGVSLVSSTTVGPDVGLDVNIIGGSISVTLNGVQTPVITNIAIPTANTEQSHTFPSSTKRARIMVRGIGTLKYAYTSTQSGTKYITVIPGNSEEIDDLDLAASLTVYFQSSKGSETLEVLSWS